MVYNTISIIHRTLPCGRKSGIQKMSFTIDLLTGEPILLEALNPDYRYDLEVATTVNHTLMALEYQHSPVFFIMDLAEANLSTDELTAGVDAVSRQAMLFQHPYVREVIFVSKDQPVDFSAWRLNSPVFEHIDFTIFGTREDALAYAREKIRNES